MHNAVENGRVGDGEASQESHGLKARMAPCGETGLIQCGRSVPDLGQSGRDRQSICMREGDDDGGTGGAGVLGAVGEARGVTTADLAAPVSGSGRSASDAATAAEWRQAFGQCVLGSGSMPGTGYEAAWTTPMSGSQDALAGQLGETVRTLMTGADDHAGHFTIHLARLGTIDGYLKVDESRVNVWLFPRSAITRVALERGRADLERAASQRAELDIFLMID